ncbi:hypothetical protein TNCV_863491 [Trichonephila clavipes]|nr:hypothetical protein TNCV_863491 [Trichonephila clavipes]
MRLTGMRHFKRGFPTLLPTEEDHYDKYAATRQGGFEKRLPNLEGKKYFNDDHREENTDFVQSIPGFQECDEGVETPGWHAMPKTVTSVQEQSYPVNDKTNEDEDNNNNESGKAPSNANALSVLETAME